MMKIENKLYKILSAVFIATLIFTLTLPFKCVFAEGAESEKILLCGYNLMEFSPFGYITLIVPFMLLAVVFSPLSPQAKMVAFLIITATNALAINAALLAKPYIFPQDVVWMSVSQPGIVLYFVTLLVAEITVFLSIATDGSEYFHSRL